MKKLLSAIFATLCLVSFQTSAQANDVSFSIGLAGNEGGYHARGTETIQETGGISSNVATVTSEAGAFTASHPSFFIEMNIGDNMTVGAEWALDDISSKQIRTLDWIEKLIRVMETQLLLKKLTQRKRILAIRQLYTFKQDCLEVFILKSCTTMLTW